MADVTTVSLAHLAGNERRDLRARTCCGRWQETDAAGGDISRYAACQANVRCTSLCGRGSWLRKPAAR